QIRQDFSGVFLVIPHLRAAVRVGKGSYSIDISLYKRLCLLFYGLCYVVNTAYCGNDPDFISYASPSVFSFISLKEPSFGGRKGVSLSVISISKKISQSCFHVVNVDPGSCSDRLFCEPDRVTVLYDRISGTKI